MWHALFFNTINLWGGVGERGVKRDAVDRASESAFCLAIHLGTVEMYVSLSHWACRWRHVEPQVQDDVAQPHPQTAGKHGRFYFSETRTKDWRGSTKIFKCNKCTSVSEIQDYGTEWKSCTRLQSVVLMNHHQVTRLRANWAEPKENNCVLWWREVLCSCERTSSHVEKPKKPNHFQKNVQKTVSKPQSRDRYEGLVLNCYLFLFN